ncbi:MAG: hypothetical protein Q612_NSC00286G0004 [Negativicoccus succinicivorans DORA_17_25]|uniref:Uncharacterized protein n=1 Tax=Negativicoccus succinicivorans DORA_17_25 TaxID=1403945 RepID=W1U4W7_9FIRM|nr:MAG: hypothetical protein Q612_NSC00286G0004 [Negativicoccus succinicivorans DORA_17_25]
MPPKMIGAPKMIRTSDTRFRKPLLYPLSYGRMLNITAAAAPRTLSRTAQPIFTYTLNRKYVTSPSRMT